MKRCFSPAAERNKQPIDEQLSQWITGHETLLEIGSGSGQHALYCAEKHPNLCWQCSDRSDYLPALIYNIGSAKQNNLPTPIELDVMRYNWGISRYNMVFTANTLHIMTAEEVAYCLSHVHLALQEEGLFIVYGPFNYHNEYTSESNRLFDETLRQRNAGSFIKSFETIEAQLSQHHFILLADVAMPANNRFIVWQWRLRS